MYIKIMKITVPNTLKSKCMSAALFAVLFAPILDKRAVIHVPMLSPNNIGNAIAKLSAPVDATAIKRPIVALLL